MEEEQAESAQMTQALAEEMKGITHESLQDDPKVGVENDDVVVSRFDFASDQHD